MIINDFGMRETWADEHTSKKCMAPLGRRGVDSAPRRHTAMSSAVCCQILQLAVWGGSHMLTLH